MLSVSHHNFASKKKQEKNALAALAQTLPLSPAIRDQLDKSGVVRVTTAFMQMRRLLSAPTVPQSIVRVVVVDYLEPPPPAATPLAVSAFNPFHSSSSTMVAPKGFLL